MCRNKFMLTLCSFLVFCLIGRNVGFSQITLTVGTGESEINLMADTPNQLVGISVMSSESPVVSGANLILSLDNGPSLQLLGLQGTIFDGGTLLPDLDASTFGINVGMLASLPGPIINNTNNQVLAIVSIDTTGHTTGSFPIQVSQTAINDQFADPLTVRFSGANTVVVGKPILLGDVNCDGALNLLDVAPFVQLLSTGVFDEKADMNQDGVINLLDVNPFVDALSQ